MQDNELQFSSARPSVPQPRYIEPAHRPNKRKWKPVDQLPFMPALPRYVRGATSKYTPAPRTR